MRSPRVLASMLSAVAATALLTGGTPSMAGAAAPGCESGPASGTWELPGSGMSNGFVDGFLFLSTSPSTQPRYAFFATLTDLPTACLSCITGRIDGYLDDGFGPAPDYVVRGSYSGLFVSGKGSFSADVFKPTGTTSVGKIKGTFSDPPPSTQPGTFKGDWSICN